MTFDINYETLVVPALWAALLIAVVTLLFMKRWKRAGIVAGVGAYILMAIVWVPAGHRGVVWGPGGVDYEERLPGISLKLPIVETVQQVNVQNQRYVTVDPEEGNPNAFIQTSDLQEVTLKVGVVWRVNPTMAAEWYDEVGSGNAENIIQSVISDAIKEESGQKEASSFAQELGDLATNMSAVIEPGLAEFHMDSVSVLVEDAIFDKDFIGAVKNKVIALERQTESLRLVQVARNEAAAAIELAEGQAEAIRRVADAEEDEKARLEMNAQEYLWFKTWNGQLPTTLVTDGNNSLLIGLE